MTFEEFDQSGHVTVADGFLEVPEGEEAQNQIFLLV
jgi:hypothetical protein